LRYLGILFLSFLVAVIATGIVRRQALARNVLDIPNERSSHKLPTPRGGGLAIVVAATVAFIGLALFGVLKVDVLMALISGGVAVAIVGFLDDHHQLSAAVRLAMHFGAALWALLWLGGLPPLRIGDQVVQFGWSGYVLGALGIVWTLNLFNFMDGIDGIAALEAMFVTWGGALLTVVAGTSGAVPAAGLVFGAACCGFLLWNWPPAKIFMGDVGSGYLGYVIAVLAVVAARENPVALLVWLVLGGLFFVDATITLVRRLLRRERVYEAHRSHAYQWLARRWKSHGRVTIAVMIVNLVWLLPCAWLAATHPGAAAWITLAALTPLIIAAIVTGAGRSESQNSKAS
jgi:Fuc2NAc and GlcNAc transferase